MLQIVSYAWSVVGVVVAAIVLYEVVPLIFKKLRHRLKYEQGKKPYFGSFADDYAGQSWAVAMFHEFFNVVYMQWVPFVGWRQAPFQGEYHTFDARGFRSTWTSPKARDAASALRVFAFGGSTTLGMGARDDHTMPSCLARRLEAMAPAVEVRNFGQIGYVMAQEVLVLWEELKRGNIPDVAVFLDGLNEIATTELNGTAGSVFQEHNRKCEFNILQEYRRPTLLQAGARALLPRTTSALGLFPAPEAPDVPFTQETALPVSAEIIELYAQSVHLVEMLAREYGFQALYFWQPSIYSKKHLSPFEQRFAAEGSGPLVHAVYARRREHQALRDLPNAIDLSNLFDDDEAGIYYDPLHSVERGNDRMAEAMAPYVIAALERALGKKTSADQNNG